MTSPALSLTISSPLDIIVKAANVTSFRAEDESGGFGLKPGHVDLLTVLGPSVIRWKQSGHDWRYCAVRAGVLTIAGGNDIRVACRHGITGSDLFRLQQDVRARYETETEAARSARVGQTKLHADAIRQIMRHLARSPGAAEESVLDGMFQ